MSQSARIENSGSKPPTSARSGLRAITLDGGPTTFMSRIVRSSPAAGNGDETRRRSRDGSVVTSPV